MFPGTDSLACVVLVTREPPLVARYSGRVRWYFCSSPSCTFFLVACCGWLGDPSSLRPLQGSPSIHQAFCIFMSWQKNDRLVEDARTRDPEQAFGTWGDVTGCPKKSTNRTKSGAVGLNFTMNMTWESLIRLSLSKKRPKNLFPDTRGASYLWLSQCTVAPTAFWRCVFFGIPCRSSSL